MSVSVANKWTGVASLTGTSTTGVIALSADTKGVLFYSVRGAGDSRPDRDFVSGQISSTTAVEFRRDTSGNEVTIDWQVLELADDVTVQRGYSAIGSSQDTNITLSPLTDINQAWEINGGSEKGGGTLGADDGYHCRVTSETNLAIFNNSGSDGTAAWQVLDFTQSADILAQRGIKTFTATDSSLLTNISPVTVTQSIAHNNGTAAGGNSFPADFGFTIKFNSPTEIQQDRNRAFVKCDTTWMVVDCKWGAVSQSGSKVLSGTTATDTVDISSVNIDKSIVFSNADFSGNGGAISDHSANDNPLYTNGTWNFNSSIELQVDRGNINHTQTWQWYVLDWEPGVVVPELEIQDLEHAHDLEAPTITTETQSDLTVQELDHAHELESPTISTEAGETLTVQDLDHSHDLESPTISTELSYLLVLQELDHGHDLESPNLSKDKELVIQELLHGHDLESPTIALFDAFGGFARRKLAGTGLNYVQYPNTGNPENFRVDVGVKTLIVEEWHPNVIDGLTKCQVRLFRDSTLIRAVSYDQNVNGGQWNQLFLEEDPVAGDYFLRTMDDQQSGIGGTGTYVYADAYQVTIDAAPQLTPQPMVHLHTMSNIGLLADYELQINNLDHPHQLESPTISDLKIVTAQDLDHGHLLDSPTITTDVQDALVVGDLTHSHDLEAPTVSYNFLSTVNDLDHGHELEQATITGELSLVIQDVDHPHDIESPTIATGDVAAAANLVHSQSIDNVILESFSTLPAVKELLHDGHQIDNVDLTYNQQLTLVVDDMTHNHVIDEAAITTDPVLFIDSIDHAHVIDSLELSVASGLQSNDMNHPHTIDTVDAFFEEDLPPLDRTYLVKPENINYIVKPENNTYVVK